MQPNIDYNGCPAAELLPLFRAGTYVLVNWSDKRYGSVGVMDLTWFELLGLASSSNNQPAERRP